MTVTETNGQRVVVKPRGDLVGDHVREIRPRLRSLVAEGVRELVIDLEGVGLVDSEAFGLFVAAIHSLSGVGGHVQLAHASPQLERALRCLRLEQHLRPRSGEGHAP